MRNLLSAVLTVGLTAPAFAQEAPPAGGGGTAAPTGGGEAAPMMEGGGGEKKMAIGGDFALAIPVSSALRDTAGIGIGVLPKFSYAIMEELLGTFRVGYIFHLKKNDLGFKEIPVLFGAKYMFGSAYGAAEIGFDHVSVDVPVPGFGTVTGSDTKPAFDIGGGYMIGDIDLRLALFMWDLGHAGDTLELMVNAGYNFVHF
jgi:hypothetical protein